MNKSMYEFKIKFDGPPNQIDALTYLNSLFSITSILHEINGELNKINQSKQRVDVKINANSKGCFIVELQLHAEQIRDLFNAAISSSGVDYCSHLMTVLVGLFTIRQFLKGKKPKEVTKDKTVTKIVNQYGETHITNNVIYEIYTTNAPAKEMINKNFETLSRDQSVNGVIIQDKDDIPLYEIKKELFKEMSDQESLEEIEQINIKIDPEAYLHIVKLGFEDTYKWDFYYEGNKITAKMEDNKFKNKIDDGEPFSKGDSIVAELEITQVFEKSVNTFVNKSYSIKKITNHVPRAKQINMFPEEEK